MPPSFPDRADKPRNHSSARWSWRGWSWEETNRLATQLLAGVVAARLEEASRGDGLLELAREVTQSWWCKLGKTCEVSMIRVFFYFTGYCNYIHPTSGSQ
jgi:hypothetical protein